MKRSLLLILIILPLLGGTSMAKLHRGLWFWQSSGSPYGSAMIVGDLLEEAAMVTFIKNYGIKRVYGSYGNRPVSEPAVIAAWNERLQNAGIQSQLLLSENDWIFPGSRPNLLVKVKDRLIDFNAAPGRTTAQKFDAVHLDIEPQALTAWSGLTPLQKRDHLFLLRDTYAELRQYLTDEGLPGFPIYADLPVWFDNLPGDGGSVGWSTATERDDWFTEISVSLTGVSLMPFDRDTFSSINNGVSWERANITLAQVRCGIEADVGLSGTWSSVPVFNAMMSTMEDAYGIAGAVDIQSYRQWREAIAAQPIIAVDAALRLVNDAWTISFEAMPGWEYQIIQSINLCHWHQIHLRRASDVGGGITFTPTDVPIQRAFWQVERYQPFSDVVEP